MGCAHWNHSGFVPLRVSSNCKGSYWILTLASKGQVLVPTCEWTAFRKRGVVIHLLHRHTHTHPDGLWRTQASHVSSYSMKAAERQFKERPIRPCPPATQERHKLLITSGMSLIRAVTE
ncbi:hypothetical protein AMECASPLE_024902 [Ameca splendens]|uniref:Uncharacterized protein n=1 Tax=Ameca splendens TaxID=208324 RepID=A0ABV0ZPE2_9TELE